MSKKKGRGRPAKLTKIRNGQVVRACPCPIHQGAFLPLNSENFHRGGNGGFQAYCRQYRNSAAKKVHRRTRKAEEASIICKKCEEKFPPTSEFWQADARRGFRQPCKTCIRKRMQNKKEKDKI